MEYLFIFLTCLIAICLIIFTIIISNKINTQSINKQKILPYECGERTIGSSWIKFNAGFYVFGLIFLLFDIETVFLIPWTLVIRNVGLVGFLEVLVFISILLLGLFFAWVKGALEWKI